MSRYLNADERIRQGAIEEMMLLTRMANPQSVEE
jgi:hypothetical protein